MDPKTQDPNPGTTAHMHIPRCRETLPPMRSLDSRHWVFLREGPGGLTAQGPQGPFLPWIHRRAPRPAPKKSQRELPEEAAHFCKLEQVGARLATPPHLEEALSAEVTVPGLWQSFMGSL
ncbi:hypothetical protein H920_03521 [Fukomys damarensis]|uniref:Uncharacterized protein n=1 Tax=Fukomys damarensis TaxID=885580 RepID=A0A091DVE1_FUKDA|nr:hypothetical protein H920_03521 [Fukomys damarensis]